jgi:hypothetical protein
VTEADDILSVLRLIMGAPPLLLKEESEETEKAGADERTRILGS